MAGAFLVMPMLILNMGGEMIYILDQRLHAQNIPEAKSVKVLVDVIKTMYSERFIEELFKPQELYSSLATRQIFERLAHSSIMRLNESSMEKLYDLMAMGFKYQMLMCSSAEQLLQVTMNHLSTIKSTVASDIVATRIDDVIVRVVQTYGNLSPGDFHLLRQLLCRFFQDKRVKVSLFLQDGIQNLDGTIAIPADGPVATGGDIPGKIKYYDANGRETRAKFIEMGSAVDAEASLGADILERPSDSCRFGENLYAPDSKKLPGILSLSQAAAKAKASGAAEAADSKGQRRSPLKSKGADEVNLLAHLLGASSVAKEEAKPFKISLFADDPFDGSKGGDSEITVQTIMIDGSRERSSAKKLAKELNLEDEPKLDKKVGDDDEDDDLLSLMDSVK